MTPLNTTSSYYLATHANEPEWVEFLLMEARRGYLPLGFIDVNGRLSLLRDLIDRGLIKDNTVLIGSHHNSFKTTDAGEEYLKALLGLQEL